MTPLARAALPQMTTRQPESEWLRRALAGDARARERLVQEQWPMVQRLLLRILGPRTDLEDLAQNVFVETLRALPAFEGRSKLSTFVGGITVKVALRAMRRPKSAPTLVALPDEVASGTQDPERRVGARRKLAQVREILEGMSEVKRVAFCLWALEGMDIEAIAELMEATPAATRSRIFYAQKELKRKAARRPELVDLIGSAS